MTVSGPPMALSAAGFAALVWGTIGLVLCVLAYQLYAIARDAGWI